MPMPDSQQYPDQLCLIKYELDIFGFVFENYSFLISVFFYKSVLNISTAGKHTGIIRIEHV